MSKLLFLTVAALLVSEATAQNRCWPIQAKPRDGLCAGEIVTAKVCAQNRAIANTIEGLVTNNLERMGSCPVTSFCQTFGGVPQTLSRIDSNYASYPMCSKFTRCSFRNTEIYSGINQQGASNSASISSQNIICNVDKDCVNTVNSPHKPCCRSINWWVQQTCASVADGATQNYFLANPGMCNIDNKNCFSLTSAANGLSVSMILPITIALISSVASLF